MTMSLHDLFEEIESSRFDANINILSGFAIFQRALRDDETLRKLTVKLRKSPEDAQEVFRRLLELLEANDQPEYAHPYDAALAGYLYALSRVDAELTQRAIEQILQTPQLWWARRLAKHLRENLTGTQTQVERSSNNTILHIWSPDTADQYDVLPSHMAEKPDIPLNLVTTASFSNVSEESPVSYITSDTATSHPRKEVI